MRKVWAVGVVVLGLLAGCECGGGVQKVEPQLGDVDDSVDFGLVALGDTALQTLRLRAMTSADVEISLKLDDNESGAFAFVGEAPTLVPGSDFIDLRIAFTPSEAEVFAATLDIVSNDAAQARRRVLLGGEGKKAEIKVTPEALELSATACAPATSSPLCSDSASALIENTGLVSLTLSAVELAGEGGGVPENLMISPPVAARQLAPGEKLQLPLKWTPSPAQASAGPTAHEAVLRVSSNDPEQPLVEVPVLARAAPNEAPTACVWVTGITRREYRVDSSGRLSVAVVTVPESEWWLGSQSGVLQVRPGYSVSVSSLAEPACTADPEGDALAHFWALSARPTESRAAMSPARAVESTFDVDAVGTYGVSLSVQDSLQLSASASLEVNATPRDDLFVQLSWDEGEVTDLDLHLLTDSGPISRGSTPLGNYGEASIFCEQDTFVFNPNPKLFDELSVLDDPRFLRDDQGTAGRLESTSLVAAPDGSSFRVAVHHYEGGSATPTLTIRLRGREFGPFTASAPLDSPGQVWFGARIEFPEAEGLEPTATGLDERAEVEAFTDVGLCP